MLASVTLCVAMVTVSVTLCVAMVTVSVTLCVAMVTVGVTLCVAIVAVGVALCVAMVTVGVTLCAAMVTVGVTLCVAMVTVGHVRAARGHHHRECSAEELDPHASLSCCHPQDSRDGVQRCQQYIPACVARQEVCTAIPRHRRCRLPLPQVTHLLSKYSTLMGLVHVSKASGKYKSL